MNLGRFGRKIFRSISVQNFAICQKWLRNIKKNSRDIRIPVGILTGNLQDTSQAHYSYSEVFGNSKRKVYEASRILTSVGY
jgi:hypothetical protein